MTPEEVTLTVGATETLTVTFDPTNATNKNITWSTSDASVATVADGVVTAVAEGTATITATSNNGETATCDVTVAYKATPDTIVGLLTTAAKGSTIQLAAGTYDLSNLSYIEPADKLTIVGGEGVAVAGITFAGLNQQNAFCPENLTLKNIDFTDTGVAINNNNVIGLTIDNCTFSNGATVKINTGTYNVENLTIKNCIFGATGGIDKTSILVQPKASNVIIRDNIITDSVYNAIQITQVDGALTIDGNTITDTGSRAIRIVTLEGANLTITDNVMSNANINEIYDEIIKIDGDITEVTASGNTYDDMEITFTDGFVRVIKATPDTLQVALDNASDGTVFILGAGEYGTIYLRQSESKSQSIDVTNWASDWDVERYREFKDISIVGTDGAKVDQITVEAMQYGTKISQPHSNSEYMTDYLSSYIAIENLTIKNIEFTGNKGPAVRLQSIWGHSSINGLTIDECSLTGKEEHKTAKESFLLAANGDTSKEIKDKTNNNLIMTTGRNNLTVKNCTVDNVWMPINVTEWHGIDIRDNNFSNTGRNDIIITGTSVGDVNIIGNTLSNAAERSIRLNTITGKISITGNTIKDCVGREIKAEDGTVLGTSLMHISVSGENTAVVLSGNSWNGLDDAVAVITNDNKILLESDVTFTVN